MLLVLLMMLLTLAFIWGNSLDSRETSRQKSDLVARLVMPALHAVLGPFVAREAIDGIDIRKIAHFAEFFLLGAEAALLFVLVRPYLAVPVYALFLFALGVAICDELLQFVSMRAPMLKDIVLDMAGASAGISASLLLACARRGKEG